MACYEWTPRQPDRGAAFRASGEASIVRDVEAHAFRISALEGERTRRQLLSDGHANISIGLVLCGVRHAQSDGDIMVSARGGAVFAYDAARPTRMHWSDGSGVSIMIRRPMAERLFGPNMPPPSVLGGIMQASPLFDHWQARMLDMARLPPELSAVNRGFLLVQLHSLTCFMLQQADPGPRSLKAAAMALIDQHLHDPRLSPDWLAGKLGCSRATLYRAFATTGRGVADLIADRRYERAWQQLVGNPGASISEVAMACGLYDTVNFSRGFRRRHGMTPSEARVRNPPLETARRGG